MKFHTPILNEVETAAQEGLREGLEALLERSNELAPEDEGELIDSGEVRIDDLTGQVSYKGRGFPYEILQHENLELEHPNGGEAKFLESAAFEVDVHEYVAARMRAKLGG